MDIVRLLPLPPALEQILNNTLPQLPTLTDALTVVFDQVPIVDNKWLFYVVAFCFIYLLIAVVLNTVRWVLNLFTFAIKVCIVIGIIAALFWLSQEGNQLDSTVFQRMASSVPKYRPPSSTGPNTPRA
jgi:amino acid transporter